MLEKDRIALAEYRLQKAEDCLQSSEKLIKIEDYPTSLNRSYYAIFHSVRALLALDGEDRRKHSGVISYFQQNYVKSGIFKKKYSDIIQEAFEIRQESDYEDFYVVSKSDAILQAEEAKDFVNAVSEYIKNSEYNISTE